MPKVSIIVPVYKAEKYLHRCVDSILAQTFTDWECILVDDGSPDGSGAICDEYAAKDARIKVIHKENGGPSSARNYGLDVVKAEYVWFVDSDDWIELDSLSIMYDIMEKTQADICFFELNPISTITIEKPFSFSSFIDAQQKLSVYKSKSECAKAIMNLDMCGGFGWTCNKWFKKSIIDNYNLRFDKRFSIQEDHLFTLSYILYVETILISSYIPYNYVISEGSLLRRKHSYVSTKQRIDAIYKARCKCCEYFQISDSKYIKWFKSDYASRLVSNLTIINESGLSKHECLHELAYTKSFLDSNDVDSARIIKFRMIKWLPNRLLLFLLKLLK